MIHYKWIRFLSMLVVLLFSITALGQNTEDFNPDSPGEPGQPNLPDKPVTPEDTATYYTLTLLAQEGGSVKSGGGQYAAGTEVQVVANAASTNFVFTGWTNERGDTIATTLSFLYTMPARNASLLAHYDFVPGSPAEPLQPDIPVTPTEPVDTTVYYSLSLLAEEGGSITAGAGNYAEGTEVTVTASAPATNFVFANWTDSNGDVVSNVRSFSYTMPAHNETLTAHYDFDPGSPSEPSQPDIPEKEPDTEPVPTHLLTITVEEGGTVTVNGTAVNGTSTIELAEGATAAIATTLSTNFTFDGWYIMNATSEELYSDSRSFTFTMDTVDVSLVAKFNFDPDAPSEPSMPTTSNNELYLMSVVGLPGETINYPLYLNSNDTLRDIRFEMQFPLMMVPDFDNVSISPNAVGYTFSYERYNMNEILGAKRRAPGDNEGEISDDYVIYDIQMTGGVTPPGNTALFIVPVTIDEDISEERHRIWLSQVEVMLNDSTVVGATTRNGAINTDYEEPDSYAYLDNIISVGSTAYSTTQAQQISHLEPFTVDVPADSIAYILGCSDVSFVTFKGRESLLKITDEQTAENGFWFGRDGYVRPFVEDADSMRMAVQYNPDTHVMSIMQYPGAYEVGDADTVKVYFTYKYKYFEVELRLSIDRADTFIELGNELREAKDSLNAIKPRIQQSYEMTGALNVNALVLKCDSLMDDMNYFLPFFENIEDGNEELSNIYNEVSQLISDTYEFIARADSIMPLYEEAFAALQEAKATLVATITELEETATQPAIDAANALVAKVNEEYTAYDVDKANEMTDSLRLAETVVRNSVVTNEKAKELALVISSLQTEKQKIEECYDKTNANDIAALRDECDELIVTTQSLQTVVDSLIETNDSITAEITEDIIANKTAVEEFIARADSIMPLYEEAFAALQEAKATLVATVEELAETASKPALDAANALVAKVNEEYITYDVAKANEMTDSLRLAETVVRNSVFTNEKAKELALVLSSLQTEKLKIEECYAKTNANDIATLGNECVELIVTTQSLQDAIDSLIETNDSITAEITEDIIANKTAVEEFIARADSIMPLYEEAFAALQEAKATLVATVEELAETATQPAIDAANALVAKVNEEYTAYDVDKANEMTDSLRLAETVIRNSVVTNEKAKELALVLSSLQTEKQKIEECYDKTNANDIADLLAECNSLIYATSELQSDVDALIENNDSITTELIAPITVLKVTVEEFIALADSIMPLYEEAFDSLMIALNRLSQTIEELRHCVIKSVIKEAEDLCDSIKQSQPYYSLTDYENAEKDINDMILYLRSLVQSEDVTIEVTESGTTEENIANPESLETLAIVGPVNGTDIRFIREGLPKLKSLDLSKAWIVEGGEAYLDSLYTTNLTIGDRMFAELPQLESLVLCDSVTTIGVEILSNTKQVTTITIPSKTQTVASGALNDSRKDIKVVWNAVEAVVPAMLNGNPNLMVYAVNGVKGEREWQNIIHDGRIDSITLRDDYPLYIPEEFHTNKVSYARKFTKKTIPNSASGWESIALPFDVRTVTHRVSGRTLAPFSAEQECDARFWLGQMTEEGFNAATSMSANTPYLVRMPNSPEYSDEDNVTGVVLFTASDSNGVLMHRTSETVVSVGNGYSLVPTYESIEASENIFALNDDYYEGYLPGSVFVRMHRDVRPMEAYIIAEEGNARLDYITLDMLQPDGIVNVENEAKNSEMVYTLTGIRINRANMKRGNIYIINGKLTKY